MTVRPDDPRIAAQAVSVKAQDGAALIGYLARPKAEGRAPGILVVHENRGLLEHIRDVVRRVATAGFVGLAVDLLSRQGGADKLTDAAAYSAELVRRDSDEMVRDLVAALDHLKAQSFVAAGRLGATGFCFGGGMVWNLLAAGTPLGAAAPYYGPRPANIGGLATTKAAVLAIYAELDTRISGSAAAVEDQLKKSDRPYRIFVLPGVDHAFHNDTGARYAPAQARQAWVATMEWFRTYLA